MRKCSEIRDILSKPEIMISPGEKEDIEIHIKVCKECERYYQISFLAESYIGKQINFDENFSDLIMQRIDTQLYQKPVFYRLYKFQNFRHAVKWLTVALCVILVAAFIIYNGILDNLGTRFGVFEDSQISLKNQDKTKNLANNQVGNDAGNIANGGFVCSNGGWVYFGVFGKGGLYKMRPDGSNIKKLNDMKARYINVVGDWVYFIDVENEINHLYKTKTDGSNLVKLNSKNCSYLSVYQNWMYYAANDSGGPSIIKMSTDGSVKKVLRSKVGLIWLIGNKLIFESHEKVNSRYAMMNLDGTGFKYIDNKNLISGYGDKMIYVGTDGKLYVSPVNDSSKLEVGDIVPAPDPDALVGDAKSIFYLSDWRLYKMKIGEKSSKILVEDTASLVNAAGDWVYYKNQDDEKKLYRIKKDGTERMSVDELVQNIQ